MGILPIGWITAAQGSTPEVPSVTKWQEISRGDPLSQQTGKSVDRSQMMISMSRGLNQNEFYWNPSSGPFYLSEYQEEYACWLEYIVVPDETVDVDLSITGDGTYSGIVYFIVLSLNSGSWTTLADDYCTADYASTASFTMDEGVSYFICTTAGNYWEDCWFDLTLDANIAKNIGAAVA